MALQRLNLGPQGETVRANVRRIRTERKLTVRQLSERMSKLGTPMLPSGITNVELGKRRVDVDVLASLAHALDVTVSSLLGEVHPEGAGRKEAEAATIDAGTLLELKTFVRARLDEEDAGLQEEVVQRAANPEPLELGPRLPNGRRAVQTSTGQVIDTVSERTAFYLPEEFHRPQEKLQTNAGIRAGLDDPEKQELVALLAAHWFCHPDYRPEWAQLEGVQEMWGCLLPKRLRAGADTSAQ